MYVCTLIFFYTFFLFLKTVFPSFSLIFFLSHFPFFCKYFSCFYSSSIFSICLFSSLLLNISLHYFAIFFNIFLPSSSNFFCTFIHYVIQTTRLVYTSITSANDSFPILLYLCIFSAVFRAALFSSFELFRFSSFRMCCVFFSSAVISFFLLSFFISRPNAPFSSGKNATAKSMRERRSCQSDRGKWPHREIEVTETGGRSRDRG